MENFIGLESIQPVYVKDQVYQIIRQALTSGKLSPGDRISESHLSRELGVSQGSVREALKEFEVEGLVKKIPNRGTYVTKLSPEEVDKIYELRAELEGFAAQLARQAGRPDEKDLSQLERALSGMREGIDRKDVWQLSGSDFQFHEAIWHLSGNPYLEKALRHTTAPLFAYVCIQDLHSDQVEANESFQKHREILDSLKTSDPLACRECVSRMVKELWLQNKRRLNL